MPQISLLGCGWLGLPLAKKLRETGYDVKGSTTSAEKIELLKQTGIEPFRIVLFGNQVTGDILPFLSGSETLIIDIPPRLRSADGENFVSKIKMLIPFIENSSVKNIIFISSTSVYGGSSAGTIDETSPLNPETESGKQLVQAEEMLKSNLQFQTTIIRFGGLIGKDRHPVNQLSGQQNVGNPDLPVNLIHQDDCIAIIVSVLDKQAWNETFNAVAPFHPTRKEYYTEKAAGFGLEIPHFDTANPSAGKIISSAKLQARLNYNFQRITDF